MQTASRPPALEDSPRALGALLVLAAVLAYLPILSVPFYGDDLPVVAGNRFLGSLRDAPMLLVTRDMFSQSGRDAGLYTPIPLLTHALVAAAFGMDPLPHHAVNLVLHALAALLCWSVLWRLTGDRGLAWIASLLFALQPASSETLGSVAARKDIVTAIFVLLGIRAHLARRHHPAAVAAFFLLALLSKENAAVFPILLVACDLFTLRRAGPSDTRPIRPASYLACLPALAAYLTLRFWALGRLGRFDEPPFVAPYAHQGYLLAIPEAFLTVLRYLKILFFPVELSISYSYADLPLLHAPAEPRALLGWGLGGAFLLAFLAGIRRAPVLAFSLAFLLVPLLPVSVIRPGWMLERYLYLPSIGWCAAVAWLLGWRGDSLHRRAGVAAEGWRAERKRAFALLLAGVLVFTMGVRAHLRARDLADEGLVIAKSYRAAPEGAGIQFLYGQTLLGGGRIPEAEAVLERVVRNLPPFEPARVELARAYLVSKRYDDAERELEIALRTVPGSSEPNYLMGLVLLNRKDFAEAARYFRRTLAAAPGHSPAAFNLGYSLHEKGSPGEAATAYEKALRRHPADPRREREKARMIESFLFAARQSRAAGRAGAAEELIALTLDLDPANPEALALKGEAAPPE